MRIISGNFKGKKISIPTDSNTRPLRDMVKESIFNLIQHSNKIEVKVNYSNILDLFSGSGSFGLECFSRGAKRITFIENYPQVLKILKKNIKTLNANESCRIIENDCFKVFENIKELEKKFDIIFLDPPYKEKKINALLDIIKENHILSPNGVVIVHRHKKDNIKITKKIKIIDERNYGISKIIIGN